MENTYYRYCDNNSNDNNDNKYTPTLPYPALPYPDLLTYLLANLEPHGIISL